MIQTKLVWHFLIFYHFLPIFKDQGFELKGGAGILQPGPQKDLDCCNRVPGLAGEEEPRLAGRIPAMMVTGSEGELVRNDQEARADFAGVM
jgi:hypothetical protein